ncbi:MAG TPA: rod-binding protein [Syntrophorhabdus sp.]|nr:rod-binding protein [Syntrophorhabdus sp.]
MSDILKLTKPMIGPDLVKHGQDITNVREISKNDQEKFEKIAEDFEALFLFNMLKELDKTTKLSEKGYMEETYMSVIYDKVSQFLAKNKGIGIKELLMRYSERGDIKI